MIAVSKWSKRMQNVFEESRPASIQSDTFRLMQESYLSFPQRSSYRPCPSISTPFVDLLPLPNALVFKPNEISHTSPALFPKALPLLRSVEGEEAPGAREDDLQSQPWSHQKGP